MYVTTGWVCETPRYKDGYDGPSGRIWIFYERKRRPITVTRLDKNVKLPLFVLYGPGLRVFPSFWRDDRNYSVIVVKSSKKDGLLFTQDMLCIYCKTNTGGGSF